LQKRRWIIGSLVLLLACAKFALWRQAGALCGAVAARVKSAAADQDGTLRTLPTPGASGNLCWTSTRDMGKAFGQIALIEREYREHPWQGLDVELTPWSGRWLASCKVSIQLYDAFRVSERFCGDQPACRAAEPLAAKLAQALARDADGKTLDRVSPPAPDAARTFDARLDAARIRFDADQAGHTPLPTFGKTPKTEYPIYGGTSAAALVEIGGKVFVARVGIGGIGWRDLGDYLVAIYTADKPDPIPVASFVVQRRVTGLKDVVASALPAMPDRAD
jgi:hypothetical protein